MSGTVRALTNRQFTPQHSPLGEFSRTTKPPKRACLSEQLSSSTYRLNSTPIRFNLSICLLVTTTVKPSAVVQFRLLKRWSTKQTSINQNQTTNKEFPRAHTGH